MSLANNKYIHDDEQDESRLTQTGLGDIRSFVHLFKYAREHKWYYINATLLMLASSFLAMCTAWFLGQLIEKGLIAKNHSLSWSLGVLVIILVGLELFVVWLSRRALARGGAMAILNIRQRLINHLQKLPLSYYDRNPQGRVVTRITHDVEALEVFFTSSLGRLMAAIFMIFFGIIAMLLTDLKIGGILVFSIFPSLILLFVTRKKNRELNRRVSKDSSSLNSRLSEYISGIEVIRSFGLEQWTKANYDKNLFKLLTSYLKANFFMSVTRPLISFLCTLPIFVLLAVGGPSVISGELQVGLFVALLRYCERFIHPFMHLAREFSVIQEAFTKAERIVAFLGEAEESEEFGADGIIDKSSTIPFQGEIEFKNVSMHYSNNEWVLKNVSFKISKGEKIGLVGTTGCGKTTAVSLLSRLYSFQEGEILIDGIPIVDYQRKYLRSQIGFVSQDVVIFKGTLRENLGSGRPLLDADMIGACRKTGLLKVMHKNSLTLDSLILEGGANLSVGERQLLALTRITLKRPQIMILDEATANIDQDFEKIIHLAIDVLMEDKTCIIVAHRLDTLKSVDRILVLDNGEVVEKGTLKDLMENKGHFYHLQQSSNSV